MEPISLTLGAVITKWAIRLWLDDTVMAGVGGDLVELVRAHVPDIMEGRRAGREFEQLSEVIARRLDPLIATEFQGLDANERSAAGLAVEKTLAIALSQCVNPIALDLDSAKLEQRVRELHPSATEEAFLSEAAANLYDLLLAESCGYVVATVEELPGFHEEATRELLSRDTRMLDLLQAALDRLPAQVPTSWGEGSEDARFASRYLTAVVARNDELQLFGVDLPKYRKKYSLSVAYISLSASLPMTKPTTRARREADDTVAAGEETSEPQTLAVDDELLRVESALGGHSRLLIGGGAGSGKTTLLQWIAVTASQKRFSGELEGWNELVPFLLPLRRYVESELPRPEEFLRLTYPTIDGAMPPAWVHRILEAGRGLVLIDGLDELPEARRKKAHEWLVELIETFPESTFLVTSRPLAISEEWTQIPDFRYVELQPMLRNDIRAFISHWHEAALGSADSDEERTDIRNAERHMLAAVDDQPSIRTLCTSPLLCALVCAMHRSNVNKLPENRMELYATALKMLVASRDEQREVKNPNLPELNYGEKFALLADFARWLHENGASDTTLATYQLRIAQKVKQLPRKKRAPGKAVATALLERSGVLRTPVEGRVDFVHRTFLEYLAASALVQDEAVDKLVIHSHLDQWRETIVMAAGHCNESQREALILGIVDRGRREFGLQHRLYLLAVACMETSTVLSEGTMDLLDDCLDAVLPPTNMTEAAAVASAGELAVSRLGRYTKPATTVAACVRALSIIGTDEAMMQLKNYSPDRRVTVSRQLIRAWGQFDGERYAKEVLSTSPLDQGHIIITDPDNLQYVQHLHKARSVFINAPGRLNDLAALAPSDLVTGIDAGHARKISDLASLRRFPNIRTLWLENVRSLARLDGIEAAKSLAGVHLSGCAALHDIDAISELDNLAVLDLVGTAVESTTPLESVFVGELRLGGPLHDLGNKLLARRLFLAYFPQLEDTSALARSEDIDFLSIGFSWTNRTRDLILPPNLTRLNVRDHREDELIIEGGSTVSVVRLTLEDKTTVRLPEFPQLRLVEFLATPFTITYPWRRFPQLREIFTWGPMPSDVEIEGFERVQRYGRHSSRQYFQRIN